MAAVIFIVVWLFCVGKCLQIGERKNHPTTGLVYGLLLGPLGVLLMCMLPSRATRK